MSPQSLMGSSMWCCGYSSPGLPHFNFKYAMPSNAGKEGPCIPSPWPGSHERGYDVNRPSPAQRVQVAYCDVNGFCSLKP